MIERNVIIPICSAAKLLIYKKLYEYKSTSATAHADIEIGNISYLRINICLSKWESKLKGYNN